MDLIVFFYPPCYAAARVNRMGLAMSIFLDSAVIDEAQQALSFGWIAGVTTNPALLARSGASPVETLKIIAAMKPHLLFYQLVSTSVEAMQKEAEAARAIAGEALVLKIPPTREGLKGLCRLSQEYSCCLTAVFSVAQAVIAAESGAHYVAVYLHRATEALGDGVALIADVAAALEPFRTEVLAASIKSVEEASAAFLAGAGHLTAGFSLLERLHENEHSSKVLEMFRNEGVGIVDPTSPAQS